MGLKKITGVKQLVDLKADVRRNVAPPSLVVHHPAMAYFRALGLSLLGITAMSNPETEQAVQEVAAALPEADDAEWSQEDARRILAAVGAVPAPSHVRVERLQGQATLICRAVRPDEQGAQQLIYREGSAQPYVSLLAALRPEGITVPRGMVMEVPVKLVEDDEGIALAAFFGRGKLRDAVSQPEEDQAGTAHPL